MPIPIEYIIHEILVKSLIRVHPTNLPTKMKLPNNNEKKRIRFVISAKKKRPNLIYARADVMMYQIMESISFVVTIAACEPLASLSTQTTWFELLELGSYEWSEQRTRWVRIFFELVNFCIQAERPT